MGGALNLIKVYHIHVWKYHNETPLYNNKKCKKYSLPCWGGARASIASSASHQIYIYKINI
jgi:hypothetical protein